VNIKKLTCAVLIMGVSVFALPQATNSASARECNGKDIPDSETCDAPNSPTSINTLSCDFDKRAVLGIPVWYKYLEGEQEIILYDNNAADPNNTPCSPVIKDAEDALPIGLAVMEAAMTVAGMVAVVMIFWGAFNFVLTQGESDKAASARKTVINAAIGLAIIIVATRVVSFIANTLTG
jgi:hypothetical protein